jgi:ribosomal protein L39E
MRNKTSLAQNAYRNLETRVLNACKMRTKRLEPAHIAWSSTPEIRLLLNFFSKPFFPQHFEQWVAFSRQEQKSQLKGHQQKKLKQNSAEPFFPAAKLKSRVKKNSTERKLKRKKLGGETSSVIGTILSGRKLYSDEAEARRHLFFVFNNPPEVCTVYLP